MDYLGEYEPHTIIYTLTVYTPPRAPPSWLPAFVTRENVSYKNYVPLRDFQIQPDPSQYPHGVIGPSSLDTMKTKQIKIKYHYIPAEMRCQHLQGKSTECDKGCYFLEKPIKEFYTKCKRGDCEGHVFGGRTKKDGEGWACFGKKGERLVAIIR
jgi:hypothetical protein